MKHVLVFLMVCACASCSRQNQRVDADTSANVDSSLPSRQVPTAFVIRDTVVEKEILLGESFPRGRLIWTVKVQHPNEHVEWRICAIVGGDTAFHHEGDDSWFMPTAPRQANKQGSPSQKVPWYTRDFFTYKRDSIWIDPPERKGVWLLPSHGRIAQYLEEHGMSAGAALRAEEIFWEYYRDRPIIMFKFPEYPGGADQRSFAYHPTIRWFLPFRNEWMVGP
jgi:hypothetical protein